LRTPGETPCSEKLHSKVYHFSNSRLFGNTKQGTQSDRGSSRGLARLGRVADGGAMGNTSKTGFIAAWPSSFKAIELAQLRPQI
jgi:hypothetical protein